MSQQAASSLQHLCLLLGLLCLPQVVCHGFGVRCCRGCTTCSVFFFLLLLVFHRNNLSFVKLFFLFMTDALVAQRDGREGEPCVISHPNSATDRGNPIFAALRTPIESGEAKTERFQQTPMKKTLFQAGLPFLCPTHTALIIVGAPQILLPPHFFPVSPSDHGRRGPNWDRPEPAPAACSEPSGGFFFCQTLLKLSNPSALAACPSPSLSAPFCTALTPQCSS